MGVAEVTFVLVPTWDAAAATASLQRLPATASLLHLLAWAAAGTGKQAGCSKRPAVGCSRQHALRKEGGGEGA